jgi:hypothetical protein
LERSSGKNSNGKTINKSLLIFKINIKIMKKLNYALIDKKIKKYIKEIIFEKYTKKLHKDIISTIASIMYDNDYSEEKKDFYPVIEGINLKVEYVNNLIISYKEKLPSMKWHKIKI